MQSSLTFSIGFFIDILGSHKSFPWLHNRSQGLVLGLLLEPSVENTLTNLLESSFNRFMMRFFLSNNLATALTSTVFALWISACGAQTAGSWETVFIEDFEHAGSSDIGPHFILPSTGDDAVKHSWTGAYSGNQVIKLRDDSGPESTIESRLIDVTDYSRVEFSFYYQGDGLEDDDQFTIVSLRACE